jgi:hypothetical protein
MLNVFLCCNQNFVEIHKPKNSNMQRILFLLLSFLCIQTGFAQKPVFVVDSTAINPWTKRPFENNPENFLDKLLANELDALSRIEEIEAQGEEKEKKMIGYLIVAMISAVKDKKVNLWVEKFASKEFSGVTTSCENWNLKTYSKYLDWIKEHSDELDCYPDEIELVLFRDAERKFSKSSNWSEK